MLSKPMYLSVASFLTVVMADPDVSGEWVLSEKGGTCVETCNAKPGLTCSEDANKAHSSEISTADQVKSVFEKVGTKCTSVYVGGKADDPSFIDYGAFGLDCSYAGGIGACGEFGQRSDEVRLCWCEPGSPAPAPAPVPECKWDPNSQRYKDLKPCQPVDCHGVHDMCLRTQGGDGNGGCRVNAAYVRGICTVYDGQYGHEDGACCYYGRRVGDNASEVMGAASATELKLVTFDGNAATTATWKDLNDPVMGGASKSTFKVTEDKTGLFNGTCAIVGFLKAPGFAKIVGSGTFADFTGYDNIAMRVKSSTPDYEGFKVAFAAPGIPKTFNSYKAGFNLTGSDWQVVEVPLTQFSYDWSAFTGRCDSKDPVGQHYCCSKSGLQPSKPEVCVEDKFLSKVNSIEVWAEGVKGDFDIEIAWIGATKSSASSSVEKVSGESVTV